MSEDTKQTQDQAPEAAEGKTVEQLKEEQATAKKTLSDARSEMRKFKKANKIRKAENITDDAIKEEFTKLETALGEAQDAYDAATEAVKAAKPKKSSGGGGAKYPYPKLIDAETGEERDLTPEEKKRWRTKARKQAKKDGIQPEEVPMDISFFDPKKPKAKKEEPAKEETPAEEPAKGEEPAKETPAEETPARPRRRRK